jgi:hypothetical protein
LFTRGKRLVVRVANMGERCVLEGRRLLGRHTHRWEDNTKIGPKKVR